MGVHDADYGQIKDLLGVPQDEPIFVLRGQDRFTFPALHRYFNIARADESVPAEWLECLGDDIELFETFCKEHPERIKTPD